MQVEPSKPGPEALRFHPLSVHEVVRDPDAASKDLVASVEPVVGSASPRRARHLPSAPAGPGKGFEEGRKDNERADGSCQESPRHSQLKKRASTRKSAAKKSPKARRQLENSFAQPAEDRSNNTQQAEGRSSSSTGGSRYNIYQYTEGDRKHSFDVKHGRTGLEDLERAWLTQMEDDAEDFVRVSSRPRSHRRSGLAINTYFAPSQR